MHKILVTGGTGSLGTALTHACLQRGYHVTVLSRDAHKQDALQKQVNRKNYLGTLRLLLGDIADLSTVLRACRAQDIVIHAAAIKRVERGETDTTEYTRVNVHGTENVAEACAQSDVARGLFISSDKSVEPLNYYGKTKALGENIWLNHNTEQTRMSCLRYGNVVNSAGSVWHVWLDALANQQPIHVRQPEPTRFALTIDSAVALVFDALHVMWRNNKGGCIYIPHGLPAFSIWDLARVIQPDQQQWIYDALITGEKQHEVLLASGEYARPTQNSNWLWQICSADQQDTTNYRSQFCSATTRQITGLEIAKMVTEQP